MNCPMLIRFILVVTVNGKPVEWPGERVSVEADLDTIPLHIRGGFVLPKQQPANNTKYSRRNPLELLVALNASRQAIGFLFWDDGEGIDTIQQKRFDLLSFVFDQDVFNITITKNVDLVSSLMLKKVTIYGIENKPNYILQNDSKLNQIIYVYDLLNLKLTLSLDLNVNKDLSFTFAGIWD